MSSFCSFFYISCTFPVLSDYEEMKCINLYKINAEVYTKGF